MKTKLIFSVLTLSACLNLPAQQSKYHDVITEFPLLWKVQMGNTTYRTNVQYTNEDLIIGSNGENYLDYYLDQQSGIYVINRKTGKIKTSFAGEDFGDMDVNGVLLHNNLLYFGNDNEEVLCTDLKGNIKWRKATSGDIEHELVTINNKGNNYLVYATETGEARAIKPSDGSTIWSYYLPDYSGWKPGDSRFVFKVQAYFSNTGSFFTKPILSDVNKDGVNDLIYNLYYGSTIILNGANGKQLTKIENTIYDKSEAFISHKKTNPIIMQINSHKDVVQNKNGETTYMTRNKINCFNVKGKLLKTTELKSEYIQSGLNALELASGDLVVPFQDSLVILKKDGNLDFINKSQTYEALDWENKKTIASRNSSEPLIANRTFTYAGIQNCVVILNQNDGAFTENGFIEIISIDTKKVIKRLQLPASSEFAPVIEDINKDGKLDLLINCRDGNLYCFDLKVPVNGNQRITASR